MSNTLKKLTILIVLLVCIQEILIGQDRISIVSSFDNKEPISIDYVFFAKKGNWITSLEDRRELQMFYEGKKWTENNSLQLKRGDILLEFLSLPNHDVPYYRVEFTNLSRDYSQYVIVHLFPCELKEDDMLNGKCTDIYQDVSKYNNRLKLPILYDFCTVILNSINEETEYYNKEFALPEIPYLNYREIPVGEYVLTIETYNKIYKTRINILSRADKRVSLDGGF